LASAAWLAHHDDSTQTMSLESTSLIPALRKFESDRSLPLDSTTILFDHVPLLVFRF
jgi:hypothetical protein